MAKVKMYGNVEGDAKVGDVIDVDATRAQQLVMGGKATYMDIADAEGHLPPVGGADVEGRTPGVEAPAKAKAKTKKSEEGQVEDVKS